MSELFSRFGVHPTMIQRWKRALFDGAFGVFAWGGSKAPEIDEERLKELNTKIWELAVANIFVTKAQALGPDVTRSMVEKGNPNLSICKQCKLLSILRSSFCYQPKGETAMNLMLVRQIHEQFPETPFFGVGQMTCHLRNDGHPVNV
ncbi:MAG: hypothetical protein AAF636_04305 [Pseudomonadota bacterium]